MVAVHNPTAAAKVTLNPSIATPDRHPSPATMIAKSAGEN
jgi:hypothetical protein